MARIFWGPDPTVLDQSAFDWATDYSSGTPESIVYIANQAHRIPQIKSQWEAVGSPLELSVLSLDEFVDRCYDRLEIGGPGSQMDQPTRQQLVERALAATREQSNLSSQGPPAIGLVEQVEDLLSLLEFAGTLSPAEIEGELTAHDLASTGAELQAVAEQFYEHRERLPDETGSVLSAERYDRVSRSELQHCFPETDAVIIGGFDTVSELAKRVLGTIVDTWPTTVVLPRLSDGNKPSGIDEGVSPAWRAFVTDLEFDPIHVSSRDSRNDGNQLLTASLFQPDSPSVPLEDTEIDIAAPSSLSNEVRFIGRRVHCLLAEGVQPDDIGVVVTDPTAYADRIADEFRSRSLPYAITKGYDLGATSVGAALLDTFELVDEPRDCEVARILLENPLVAPSFPEWSEVTTRDVADALDDVETLAELDDPFYSAVLELSANAETVADADTVSAYQSLVADLGIESAAKHQTTTGSQRVVYRSAERVLEAVKRTSAGAHSEGVATCSDLDRARRSLEAVSVVDDPSTRDERVEILGPTEVGMRTFDHVFVLGLTATHFPTSPTRLAVVDAVTDTYPKITEADRPRVAEYRIAGLMAAANSATLTRPCQQLDGTEYVDAGILAEIRRLTDADHRRRDEFGHLLDRSADGPHDRVCARGDLQRAQAVTGPHLETDQFRACVNETCEVDGFAAPGASDYLECSSNPSDGVQLGLEAALDRSGSLPTSRNGWLGKRTIKGLEFSAEKISPTELETYAACPFRFYAEEVLDLEDPDRDEKWIVRGQFVHDILEQFYTGLSEEVGIPVSLTHFDREELESRLLSLANERQCTTEREMEEAWLFELLAGLGNPEHNDYYDRQTLDGQPRGILVRFLEEELDLLVDPEGNLQDGPLAVSPSLFESEQFIDVQGTTVGGIFDRADIAPDGRAVVRDYKTGSTPSERDSLDGLAFQLAIYAKMVEENVDDVSEVVGGTYYRLQSPGSVSSTAGQIGFVGEETENASWRGDSYREGYGGTPMVYQSTDKPSLESRTEFREFLDDVVQKRLSTIVAGIEAGTFHPAINDPDDAGCSNCSFRSVCDVRSHRRQQFVEAAEGSERAVYVPPIALDQEWEPDMEVN